MSLTAGTRLDPYEIAALLGAGGMGEVYKARDTRLERSVAIKVLPPHLARDPEFRERFEREARTISSLMINVAADESTASPITVILNWRPNSVASR